MVTSSTNQGDVVATSVVEDHPDDREEIHVPGVGALQELAHRLGGGGAFENVAEVLMARAESAAAMNAFEDRVARLVAIRPAPVDGSDVRGALAA